jgi:hypothetical protein
VADSCVNGRCTKEGNPCRTCGLPCLDVAGRASRVYCSKRCQGRRGRKRGIKPAIANCLVCGVGIPQDLKSPGRVKELCSPRCRRARMGRGKPDVIPCKSCGAPVPQDVNAKGRPRTTCSKECRDRASAIPRNCRRCGVEFLSGEGRQFCSDRCRWPSQLSDPVNCSVCGGLFTRAHHTNKTCSTKCREVAVANAVAATVRRNSQRAAVYKCLNCGEDFKRKRYASGAYSRQEKYCSRECAFEARRMGKPCARRPSEAARGLAGWFLSWGDDQWPAMSRCPDCGGRFCSQKQADSESHEKCHSCQKQAKKPDIIPCKSCGAPVTQVGHGRRFCTDCAWSRESERRRASRRKHRERHGNACTFRQRCKRYGAPYTKVSRQAVMERGGWVCQLCGAALLRSFVTIAGTRTPHPRCPTIDHIVPLSFGPTSPGHVFDNCQAACWACNCERGTQDADSFARRKATR